MGQRVEAVGDDRHFARVVSERNLGGCDNEIETKDLIEDFGDFGIAVAGHISNAECRIQNADSASRVVSAFCIPNSELQRESQNTRACGMGHQRSWTRPMMYFFGTIPQCRLSELLFRWSPITK